MVLDMTRRRAGYINLDLYAQEWTPRHFPDLREGENPLNDPDVCNRMVSDLHEERGWDASYGGYFEDRSYLWRGSYLEKTGAFTHLGYDFNAPAGTHVISNCVMKILQVDDDTPLVGGWGGRVIGQVMWRQNPKLIILYAHLNPDHIRCKPGDIVTRGQGFARIGEPKHNGYWFPHTHVQLMTSEVFRSYYLNGRLDDLDGYGCREDIPSLARQHLDVLHLFGRIVS